MREKILPGKIIRFLKRRDMKCKYNNKNIYWVKQILKIK